MMKLSRFVITTWIADQPSRRCVHHGNHGNHGNHELCFKIFKLRTRRYGQLTLRSAGALRDAMGCSGVTGALDPQMA